MILGAHQSIAGGVSRAFARGEADGASAIQIFRRNARGWTDAELADDERRLFQAEAKRTRLWAIARGSYLTHLATDDAALRQKALDCASAIRLLRSFERS